MASNPLFGSPSFKRVAKGLVELHRLDKAGKDDSPEAEAVRDALDAPLDALNQVEKERAQWLSEDLYSVSEPAATNGQKPMTPLAQQQLVEANEARQNREWDRALDLLRQLRESVSPAVLSYLRGTIWDELEYAELAAFFYEHASECEPTNTKYPALYLGALAESDPVAASKVAREV